MQELSQHFSVSLVVPEVLPSGADAGNPPSLNNQLCGLTASPKGRGHPSLIVTVSATPTSGCGWPSSGMRLRISPISTEIDGPRLDHDVVWCDDHSRGEAERATLVIVRQKAARHKVRRRASGFTIKYNIFLIL